MGYSNVLRLTPSRIGPLVFLISGVLILLFGLFIAVVQNWLGGLLLAAFSCSVLTIPTMYLWPGRVYLDLTSHGFHEQGLQRGNTRTVAWSDIDSFFVASIPRRAARAAFRLRNQQALHLSAPERSRYHDPSIDCLWEDYRMSAPALADLLNEWRARYGEKTSPTKELIDDWV